MHEIIFIASYFKIFIRLFFNSISLLYLNLISELKCKKVMEQIADIYYCKKICILIGKREALLTITIELLFYYYF